MMMCLSAFAVLAEYLCFQSSHCLVVIRSYVIWGIEDRYYPHDTLVYNLPFLEGDTSGHVIDRCPIRMGHPCRGAAALAARFSLAAALLGSNTRQQGLPFLDMNIGDVDVAPLTLFVTRSCILLNHLLELGVLESDAPADN